MTMIYTFSNVGPDNCERVRLGEIIIFHYLSNKTQNRSIIHVVMNCYKLRNSITKGEAKPKLQKYI